MSVLVETAGPVTTIVIDRPERRNAVDPATAAALREAFDAFEADEDAAGRGADRRRRPFLRRLRPQGLRRGRRRLRSARRRADGPDPAAAFQAGDRRGRGLCGGGRAWSSLCGATCGSPSETRDLRRLLPALGRAADRRRHGAAAAHRRPGPGARPDPDRPPGRRRARRLRSGLANRVVPAGQARAEAEALAAEIARFPQLCMRTDRASAYAGWDGDARATPSQPKRSAGAAPLAAGRPRRRRPLRRRPRPGRRFRGDLGPLISRAGMSELGLTLRARLAPHRGGTRHGMDADAVEALRRFFGPLAPHGILDVAGRQGPDRLRVHDPLPRVFGAAFASFGQTTDPSHCSPSVRAPLLLGLAYMILVLAIIIPDIAVRCGGCTTQLSGWWILAPLGSYLIGVVAMVVLGASGASMQPGDQDRHRSDGHRRHCQPCGDARRARFGLTLLVFMFLDGTPGPNRRPRPEGTGCERGVRLSQSGGRDPRRDKGRMPRLDQRAEMTQLPRRMGGAPSGRECNGLYVDAAEALRRFFGPLAAQGILDLDPVPSHRLHRRGHSRVRSAAAAAAEGRRDRDRRRRRGGAVRSSSCWTSSLCLAR